MLVNLELNLKKSDYKYGGDLSMFLKETKRLLYSPVYIISS